MKDYKIIQEFSQKNPMSICSCGHTGDGRNSDHQDFFQSGHGKCNKCNCEQFTWVGWTSEAKKVLDLV